MNNKDSYEYILSVVYDMLRFAEAKNGVLLTLVTGLILIVNENKWLEGNDLTIMNILLMIPILILLNSFVPSFNKKNFFKEKFKNVDKESFNILNIQDLSTVPDELLKTGELNKYLNKYEISIQRQIGFNSQITMNKFKSFSLAIIFLCIDVALFILLVNI